MILAILLPLAGLLLVWYYLYRNTLPVPVSPGARFGTGHMHHFFGIDTGALYMFEQIYFKLTDPVHGAITHMRFFCWSNLSLNTVRTGEILLKSNTNINKSFLYNDFLMLLKDSVLVLKDEKWLKRRRLLTPVFHFNILEDFENVMKKHAMIMLDLLHKNPETPIIKLIEQITFHSLAETSFGVEYKSVDDSKELLEVLGAIAKALFVKGFNILNKIDWYYNRTASGKKLNALMDEMTRMVTELINERKRDMERGETKLHKGHRSFLDHLVFEQAKNPAELTDEQIIGESNTILFAGHGTTTGTIGFCVYYLCKHPDVQEKVHQEIVDQLQGKKLEELNMGNLPYLTMVVKETLRLQPPASFIGRRLSAPMTVDGMVIPAGTNIDISIWWMHRDPEHWPDPEKFDPERFSAENSRGRNAYAFVPFAAGPRNCIGQRFGLIETKILVAALVYGFKMTCDQEMGKELCRDVKDVSVIPGPNFSVQFEQRL